MPTPHPRRWHREGRFGDGPRMPLCRERRAVWKARLRLYRRAGKLTPLYEDIGLAMLKRLGADGRLDPSHQTVADDVGCDPRSVRRALAAFKACGLVMWVQRLVRAGWRVEQVSNAYALTIGDPPPIPPARTGGQLVRETRQKSFNLPSPAADVAAARSALVQRRAAIEKQMLTRGRRYQHPGPGPR